MGANCFLIFCYLILSQRLGHDRLSRLMNAAMFLLLMVLGVMTLAYAGGMLFGTGLVKIVAASIIKKIPHLLLLAASSSLVFTMISLDFWKKPVLITPNRTENIEYTMLMALSQNALLLTWLVLNKYNVSNNFINIAVPAITTTIFYQNFAQYLPKYLQKISFSSLRVTELFCGKYFQRAFLPVAPRRSLRGPEKSRLNAKQEKIEKPGSRGLRRGATGPGERLLNKYRYFWQNFSKNILNLVNKEALHQQHNKLFALDFINLYNEHSNQAKIISLEKIIGKLRQHKAKTVWLNVFELILNFLQKFAPEINVTSSQKMISGLINLFQKLVIGFVDDDNDTLFIAIKKIVATLLELNNQIKNNSNIDIYVKMHIYLAIQSIIKQLSSDKLYAKQNIENINELIGSLEHALCAQAKPDYFNINYANIIMNSGLGNVPIIIKRPPDKKYQNDDCAVFRVENIRVANKTYQVTLITRMDIKLYELDYLDWEVGLDFKDINIVDQNGVKSINAEYTQVLVVLKNLPKFLGKELTRPDAIATEVFAVTSDLIPALGKIQELIVAPIINLDSDILTEDFLNNLRDVMQKFSPIQMHNVIVKNYKNILAKAIKYDNYVDLEIQMKKADDLLTPNAVFFNSSTHGPS